MAKDLGAYVHSVAPGGSDSNSATAPVVISFGFDPVVMGVAAAPGSIGLRTDYPSLYLKTGTSSTSWAALGYLPGSLVATAVWFGDGIDLPQTFNGGAVRGATLSGTVYTLTRDIFLGDGSTIASGYTVATNGFRVFCAGTLTNHGAISADGTSGNGAVGGRSGTPNTDGSGNAFRGFFIGMAGGGVGATANGAGGNGSSGGSTIGAPLTTGQGGSGGNAGTNLGGTSFPPVPVGAQAGGLTIVGGMTGRLENALVNSYTYGTGGGGGALLGTNPTTGLGGGGGGGGGWCFVAARALLGTGTITANGGNGANGSLGNAAAVGGGGGGGGGIVFVVYFTNPGPNTFNASGGSAGSGAGVGGASGGAGTNGSMITLNVSGDGT